MTTNNQPLATAKAPSTLARAKFGPGMLLQHDDLEQLSLYTRDLSRMLMSSLFGCGVVCGLVVQVEPKCGKVLVNVSSGLALDCQGDPIFVPRSQTVVLDEECKPDIPARLWVELCGTCKCCGPRTSMCAADDESTTSVCTRERDWFEIRIVQTRPKCSCSCPEPDANDLARVLPDTRCECADPASPCYKDHYAGTCGCDCDDCSKCDCNCVLLARLDWNKDIQQPVWTVDHRVRRFVRPVLMRDPQVTLEEQTRDQASKKQKDTDKDKVDTEEGKARARESHAEARAQGKPTTREPAKR
jgi:hypothetical protein